jgi:hypothetical protein
MANNEFIVIRFQELDSVPAFKAFDRISVHLRKFNIKYNLILNYPASSYRVCIIDGNARIRFNPGDYLGLSYKTGNFYPIKANNI